METGEPSRPLSQSSMESVDMSISYSPPDSTGRMKEELAGAWPPNCVFPVLEILTTEESYVQSLEQLLKGYRDPLSSWLQNTEEGETFIRSVFLNLGQLFNVHRRLLQTLQDKATDPMAFGQVFVKAEEDFTCYTEYCTNFNSATEILRQTKEANAELKNYLEVCQQKLHHAMPLSAYLIKPVQRITKYHLLVKGVLKHYNTEHYAYPSLRAALVAMERTAEHINNVKKQQENTLRSKEIQQSLCGGPRGNKLTTYGELIQECKCKVHVGKKGAERERELVIFEKLLLLLKKKDSNRYNYKGHIEVGELKLDEVNGEPTVFKVYSDGGVSRPSQSYHIQVRSERVKQEVMEKIREVIQCHVVCLRKKNLENRQRMRRTHYSYQPSDYSRGAPIQSAPSRKRKALSEIFPTSQGESGSQLQKASRTDSEHPEIRVDGWSEGEEGWMEEEEEEEQRVPDGSSSGLPVIEEGSIFSHSSSDQLLTAGKYGDKRSPTKSKMSSSVSTESMVSLSDVEFGEKEEEGGVGMRRYLEECDSGEVGEGERGRGEGGETAGDSHKKIPRQVSNLRRKPAIRIKTVTTSANSSPAIPKRHLARSLIREKAQLARAASYAVTNKDVDESPSATESSDLIGPEAGVGSHDLSLDSSSVSVCVEKENAEEQVLTGEKELSVGGDGHGDGSHADNDKGEGFEIVDSSDSEDEEEEEEEIMSGASIEDELGSSLEQPQMVSRQKSNSSSSSHEDQSSSEVHHYQLISGGGGEQAGIREKMVIEGVSPIAGGGEGKIVGGGGGGGGGGGEEGVLVSDGVQSSVISQLSSPPPPPPPGGMGMEDSGFGTGDSWRSTEPGDLDPLSPAASLLGKEEEAPLTTSQSLQPTSDLADHYATLPRLKTSTTSSPSVQGVPKPPHTLLFPVDYSPGQPPHSHKSSSPSSSTSSLSRSGTKKSSRGFSRLVEYTRKLSSPAYSEEDQVSQSLPPGSLADSRILEEPPEMHFVDKVFNESLGIVGEDEEEEDEGEGVLRIPLAKKLALNDSHTEGYPLESMAISSSGENAIEISGTASDFGTKENSVEAVSLPREENTTVEEISRTNLDESISMRQEIEVGGETLEMEVPADGQTVALPLICQNESREEDSVTPQPIPGDLPVTEGEVIAPVRETGTREREGEEEGESGEVRDDSGTPELETPAQTTEPALYGEVQKKELPQPTQSAIENVSLSATSQSTMEEWGTGEGEGGEFPVSVSMDEVEKLLPEQGVEDTLPESAAKKEEREEEATSSQTSEEEGQHSEAVTVEETWFEPTVELPVAGPEIVEDLLVVEKTELETVELAIPEPTIDRELKEAKKNEIVTDEEGEVCAVEVAAIDKEEEIVSKTDSLADNTARDNLMENGFKHTDRQQDSEEQKNAEPHVINEDKATESKEKAENVVTSQFQLNRRTRQPSENRAQRHSAAAVTEASVSLGLFGTLRRLRQWTIFSNRRIILVFGAVGLVTLASALFIGVNLYYDGEAKRPAEAL